VAPGSSGARRDRPESLEPEGGDALKVAGLALLNPIMRRPCADREEKQVTRGNDMRRERQLGPNNPNQRRLLGRVSIGRMHRR